MTKVKQMNCKMGQVHVFMREVWFTDINPNSSEQDCFLQYFFRTSLRRDKNKMGKLKALVKYPGVQYQCDTRVLSSTASAIILPLFFLFNYNMALLGVILPIYFCPVQAKFSSYMTSRIKMDMMVVWLQIKLLIPV